jgi:hypothetical protein
MGGGVKNFGLQLNLKEVPASQQTIQLERLKKSLPDLLTQPASCTMNTVSKLILLGVLLHRPANNYFAFIFFSDNGQSKMFRIFLSTMFSAGHVGPHHNNASTTEYNIYQS